MFSRLNKLIKKHHILIASHFDFRSGLSTADVLLQFLVAPQKRLNVQSHNLAIYLDFSKAMDTVNHEIFFNKSATSISEESPNIGSGPD